MSIKKLVCIALASLLLVACGTPPRLQPLQPKTQGPAEYTLSRSALVENTSHVTQHLDKDKSVLYFQNYGGGGVGLGLLLGPLGVAANVAMIEGVSKKDAEQLRDKISVRPREIFAEVAARQGLNVSAELASQKLKVTPYLYVSKTEGDILLVSSALIIEHEAGADKWTGKYMYQLPLKYSISELSKLGDGETAQLREAVAAGFAQLVTNIRAESPERLALEQKVLFKSDFVNPRFDYEMFGSLIAEDSSVVWIRTVNGVYALRKPNVSFTVQKS
jgi:hypothetical protein